MNIREATIDDAKGLLYHVKAVLGSRTSTLTTLDEFKQSEDTQLEMKKICLQFISGNEVAI